MHYLQLYLSHYYCCWYYYFCYYSRTTTATSTTVTTADDTTESNVFFNVAGLILNMTIQFSLFLYMKKVNLAFNKKNICFPVQLTNHLFNALCFGLFVVWIKQVTLCILKIYSAILKLTVGRMPIDWRFF